MKYDEMFHQNAAFVPIKHKLHTFAICYLQFGFATFTSYDFHCLFHFWRVIGHCLGIADEFNPCSGSDEEVVEHCRQTFTEYWLPKLKTIEQDEPEGVKFLKSLFPAFSFLRALLFNIVDYDVTQRYLATILQMDTDRFPLDTLWKRIAFQLFQWGIILLNYSVWYNWFFTQHVRVIIWLSLLGTKILKQSVIGGKYRFEIVMDERCPYDASFHSKYAWELNLY